MSPDSESRAVQSGCTSRFPALIDRLLVDDLPPRKMRELRGHLPACPECQHRYNRVVLAGRLLDGGPAALDRPSDRELARVGQAVLERARLVPDSAPARRGIVAWVTALAAVAGVVAIVLPVALRAPHRDATGPANAEFQVRGTPTPTNEALALRAFCIHPTSRPEDQPPAIFEAANVASAGAPACQVADTLRFAYTNRSGLRYLFLVGVDDAYRLKWYEPHPPQTTSIAVKQQAVDQPLSRAVRLAVNHQQGAVRLFGIFSDAPVHAAEIERAVAQAKAAGTPLARLQELPLPNTSQRSILLQLDR